MKSYRHIKRIIDITIAAILLIVFIPLYIIIGIIIKLESKGPIIFVHRRVGKNGKMFGLYKFRTMVNNAEEMIQNFTVKQMEEYKRSYKLQEDPRVTKVGKILRRTSLDELPQVINILKGDLSIVGPRPVITEEVEKYGEDKEKLLSVTPGLTGYWVANSNKNTTYEERIEMELYYVDNISFKLDLKILLGTVKTVITRMNERQ